MRNSPDIGDYSTFAIDCQRNFGIRARMHLIVSRIPQKRVYSLTKCLASVTIYGSSRKGKER
jgi:hypothetical protein